MMNQNHLVKFETGSKAALPIFKEFIERALYKEDIKPFKSPSNIYFFPVDYKNGKDVNFTNKKAIIEAFKEKTVQDIKVKKFKYWRKLW